MARAKKFARHFQYHQTLCVRYGKILAFALALALFSASSVHSLLENTGFLKGLTSKKDLPVDILYNIGANSVCIFLCWNDIEPVLSDNLPVWDIEANPGLIDDFIISHDWSAFDRRIQTFIDAGISVFAVVGCGFDSQLPLFNGKPATPDWLGRENYLGHISLYVSAVARKYGDRIKGFILEDELNEAALTALLGWRSPSPLKSESLWSDFNFLTELIQSLSRAVRSEAPSTLVIANFHTDIHPNFRSIPFLHSIVGSRNWPQAVLEWQYYIDVIALDTYPNYYVADPVYGSDVGNKIVDAIALGTGKPIIILGTAYSVTRQGENPDPVNWTEEKQDDYVNEAIRSSLKAGASGFFYFDPAGQGCIPPTGGYTEKDLSALENFGVLFRNGDLLEILVLIFDFDPDYLQGRFVEVLQAGEGFGFIKPDGSKRKAYYTMRWWYKRAIPKLEMRARLANIIVPQHLEEMRCKNYPNPFNPDTWIPYNLEKDSHVVIRIYTATGQLIRVLDLGCKLAGSYTDRQNAAYWDGNNEAGERVGSGVYFYSIKAGNFMSTGKMIIME